MFVSGLGGPTWGEKLMAVGQMAGAIVQKAQGDPDAQANFDAAQTKLRSLSRTPQEKAALFMAGAKQAARTIEIKKRTERLVAETMEVGPTQYTGAYADAAPVQAGFFGDVDPQTIMKYVLFAGVGFMLFTLATAKPKRKRAVARPAFRR